MSGASGDVASGVLEEAGEWYAEDEGGQLIGSWLANFLMSRETASISVAR